MFLYVKKPATLLIFPEGVIFTGVRKGRKKAEFLFNPMALGFEISLSVFKERKHKVIDVSIAYPGDLSKVSLWQIFCGKAANTKVRLQVLDLPEDYGRDKKFYSQFLYDLWSKKDTYISDMKSEIN